MVLTAVAIGCGGLVVGVSVFGNLQPERDVVELNQRIVPESAALARTADEHARSDALFQTALGGPPEDLPATLSEAVSARNRAGQAWRKYEHKAFGSAAELRLQQRYRKSVKDGTAAGAAVVGLIDSPDRAAYDAAFDRVHQLSIRTDETLTAIRKRFYDSKRSMYLQQAETSLASARSWTLIAFGLVLLGGLLNALVLLRGAFREERDSRRGDQVRHRVQQRSHLENGLQRGLEMKSNEEATYPVIRKALRQARPEQPVEVLIADSSQAHFHQVVSTDADGLPGCGVAWPGDCPASSSGQTRVFPSSSSLDACPYLEDRDDGPMSATCVPISIAGANNGMIHTTGPDHETLTADEVTDLELIARKAGDRIGFLRVLARTETQAHVDPLTGLLNRRSLEQHSSELMELGGEFVVAYADLDHFKNLNDKHGHETGDRALRLFGRVVRDSIRPADVAARYGGEEFVVLLPNCNLVDARIIANRMRDRLATAIGGATIPTFTVSMGLAAWEAPETFDDTVARADAALLMAKRAGRDRVLSAADLPEPDDPAQMKFVDDPRDPPTPVAA